jgi:acyl-CoA thioester hydrolase
METPAPPAASRKPKTLADYARFQTITTRWMDNDVYQHVNNVVYYSFFDTAVNGMLIAAGVLDLASSEVVGLVVETGCQYFSPVSFPDTINAGVNVTHLGRSSVRYDIGLFRNAEDIEAAAGFFVHVYVNRKTNRPTAIPGDVREFLQSFTAPG